MLIVVVNVGDVVLIDVIGGGLVVMLVVVDVGW